MAAGAAHFASYIQTKPTIFEVIAQECLAEDIAPAFKHIVKFLFTSNPEKFKWIYNWCEECYLLINGFVQYNYLKYRNSSFEETFYGFERISLYSSLLSYKQKYLSLVCLVVLPYINSKFEKEVEKYCLESANDPDSLIKAPKNVKEGFVLLYRLFHFVWRMASLIQYLLYMTGNSVNYSVLHRLLNISLVYRKDLGDKPIREMWRQAWKDIFIFPDISAELVIKTFSFIMEIAAFYLQCLNWYYLNINTTKMNILPVPTPPSFEKKCDKKNDDLCPICVKKRKLDTALLTSGQVFCFKCIKNTIDNTKKCPVTGISSTINDLIRIYHEW